VEAVAVYLAQYPDIRPADYLARLRHEGLPGADTVAHDADVAAQMRHREKQLGVVVDATLGRLSEAARLALASAAVLPPDAVPWPWLQLLVREERPDLLQTQPGYPDPWRGVRRELDAFRLLTASPHPEIAQLHRLIGAHVRRALTEDRERAVFAALDTLLARM